MAIWFTADTHFGHKNIVKYCRRPFTTVQEMDDTIIENWNRVVGKTDTVYHLGDFSMRNPVHYRERLNGKIHLILGNHDQGQSKKRLSVFDSVQPVCQLKVNYGTPYIFMSHYAHRVWPRSHHGAIHLYGHSHGVLEEWGRSMDVGVDANNFTPISLEEVLQIMEGRFNDDWVARLPGA